VQRKDVVRSMMTFGYGRWGKILADSVRSASASLSCRITGFPMDKVSETSGRVRLCLKDECFPFRHFVSSQGVPNKTKDEVQSFCECFVKANFSPQPPSDGVRFIVSLWNVEIFGTVLQVTLDRGYFCGEMGCRFVSQATERATLLRTDHIFTVISINSFLA